MNWNEVAELVKKNLRNLVRAKAGSLIVILGPLLIIFLAGMAFDNSNVYSVKLGTYRPDVTDITTEFLDQLRTEFKVYEYDSEEDCINAIKNTDINACMMFAGNFTIGDSRNNEITFYVDYSRINLVWTIMNVMTEEVGEHALEASKNLTKVLLEAIDYTQAQIGEQRKIMVRLTTENELITSNTKDLMAELGDIDLTFDESKFSVEEISSANTQVKQWVDNSLKIGEKGLNKASSFIDAAHSIAKSGGGGTIQDKLLEDFQKKVDEIKELKADMSKTKELTQESYKEFQQKLQELTESIKSTKAKLQDADTSREFSIRVLDAMNILLDKSIISLLEVQQTINGIDQKLGSIAIKDPEAITQPIVTTIKPVVQEETYLNYLFPVLIVLVIMFTALLISPTLVLLEKHSPANFRTYMTPVKDSSYVLANFITSSILLFLQVIIILAISSIFFTSQIFSNAPEAIFLLLIINSLFILIGMIIGYIFNSEETATLAGVSIGAIFLFISDVIIPIESMPEAFAYIASFNPYVLGSSLLRRALLFDSSILSMIGDILILLGYIIATALLATGIYLLTRKYSMQKLLEKLAPVLAKIRLK